MIAFLLKLHLYFIITTRNIPPSFLHTQFVQNIQEFLLPKLRQKFNLWMCCGSGDASADANDEKTEISMTNFDDLHIEEMSETDPRIKQVELFLCARPRHTVDINLSSSFHRFNLLFSVSFLSVFCVSNVKPSVECS